MRKVIGPIMAQYQVEYVVNPDLTKLPRSSEGDVVLSFGGKAMDVLKAMGMMPKNRTLTSMREKPVKIEGGGHLLVTFDPTIVSRDYARLPEIQWDTQLALRLHETGSIRPVVGDYRMVESFHEIIERVEALYEKIGKPVEVACDLETKGLDEYNPAAWIISCSFTVDEGHSQVAYFKKGEAPHAPPPWKAENEWDYWEGLWAQVHWILTSPKVTIRGANFKFDSRWLTHKWGIYCTNHKFDTLLVGSLLDENRSNTLKLHAKIMTPLGGYEDDMDRYDFSALELVPPDELVQYNGGDTDATLRVSRVMKTELLKDKALTNFYMKVLHPSSKVFEKVERNGIVVDVPYYRSLEQELESEVDRLHAEMINLIPNKLKIRYKDNLSITRPVLMRDFLFTQDGLNLKPQMFTEKDKEPSTSGDHLMMFADNPDAANFISLYKEYGSAAKTLSTYVVGFLKHLRSDGRFHPTFMLHRGDYGGDDAGAVTGRTSAKDPAVQTIPKHTKWTKRLRRAFIAPPGKTILQLDYSQGELRITAVLAEEPTMIQAYRDGKDLHAITAARLNNYSLEDFMLLPEEIRDELRSGGKAGNFGLIYGMGAEGYKDYAFYSYGVKLIIEEAHNQRVAFFELYSRLLEWHNEYKALARKCGFVRSPLGRVRHLPLITSSDREARSKAERQSINSPVQSCLSDMMQMSMVAIDREYGDQVEMFLMTHDSVAMYIPLGEEVQWAKRCKAIMENLPLEKDFGWRSPLRFPVDAEVGVPDESGIISLMKLQKLKGL